MGDHCPTFLSSNHIRMQKDKTTPSPLARAARRLGLALVLLGAALAAQAQRPQFSKWNAGLVLGRGPLNGDTWMPTLRGHMGPWSLELAPYAFASSVAASYHHALPFLKRRATVSLDGTAYFTRQNSLYYLTFPQLRSFQNLNEVGLLAGPSFYFLKRARFQFMLGAGYEMPFGEQPLHQFPRYAHLIEKAAISLEYALFKTFAQ